MKDVNNTETLKSEKKLLSSEQAKYFYNLREKSKRDWISGLANAEERGIERAKITIAEKMLKRGNSVKEVVELTDLPENEIWKLTKQ